VSFKFALSSQRVTINNEWTILITEPDGNIVSPSENGLYLFDTRLISGWAAYANGQTWDLRTSTMLSHYAARYFLSNRAFSTQNRLVKPATVGLVISRYLAGGMHEDLDITNYSIDRVRFQLEIAIISDFDDLLDVKLGGIGKRGLIRSAWSEEKQQLRTSYASIAKVGQDTFRREFRLKLNRHSTQAVYANGRIIFEIDLPPGEVWHACLLYAFADGDRCLKPPADCLTFLAKTEEAKRLAKWRSKMPYIGTENEEFRQQVDQALSDTMALRLPSPDFDANLFFPAAGIPWFATIFGRDSLIASTQLLLIDPNFARGTLEILGSKQGRTQDDFHDEQPGRILHELRFGELSRLKSSLFTPYFGTADATILYLITLHATWMATGDSGLLERHLDTAEHCLEWIDTYGDLDGDGFQEYQTNSPRGYENLGWKDSADAVLYPDGTPVKGPKALCELQGYVYDAWLRMADIYSTIGNSRRAEDLRQKARALSRQFDAQFWDEEFGCYAYALDGDKRKVLTLASNVGHCLWSGIVPDDRAERVVKRLMKPDMCSGWGIRTCSAQHPAFNPYSYHNGSVWPHDNSLIAIGFRRYGFVDEALRIIHDVCDAATHFQLNQLPEFYAGVHRGAVTQSNLMKGTYYVEPIERVYANTSDCPVQCSQASVPQAWAAGATFSFLQTLLGIEPDAPRGRIYLDPHLPPWLRAVKIEGLRLGKAKFAIQFRRAEHKTSFDVSGDRVEVRHGSLDKLTWSADTRP
jgi:glycogen debranching enzyme